MADLSWYYDEVNILVSPAEYDEQGNLVSPAIYEQQLVERARGHQKSEADVERVLKIHDYILNKATGVNIEAYLNALQWEWFDEYQGYLIEVEDVEKWNEEVAGTVSHTVTTYVRDEETGEVLEELTEDVLYDPKPTPTLRERPPLWTCEDFLEAHSTYQKANRKKAQLDGVEFEGVMCSATSVDMYGLSSIEEWIRYGNSTNFLFDNGNTLVLSLENIDDFKQTWTPFRASFF